ncbi:uncharacterized protein METZ01_LOCUS189965, partial [marine metagenome]
MLPKYSANAAMSASLKEDMRDPL